MIGILNVGLGNIQSVYNAIYENGYDPVLVDSPEQLEELTHFVLPGVGNFSAVMSLLDQLGFIEPIKAYIDSGKPTLGICLGMQLLAAIGTEGGQSTGLGFIPAKVESLDKSLGFRIPHVGWNEVSFAQQHPIFEDIKDHRDFYFVHSFHMTCSEPQHVLATTDYCQGFVSVVGAKNVVGVQFHPEKSQKNGMQLLENFCEWDGQC